MDINELLGRFRSDPEFAAKYRNLSNVNEVQAQLKADGYDVSVDEIRAGIGQLQGASGELSEAELAGIAGGGGSNESWKSCPKCGSKNIKEQQFGSHTQYTCLDCGYSATYITPMGG